LAADTGGQVQHNALLSLLVPNLIAPGAGFAILRDYAKLGVMYLQNGVWDGDRLLPQGRADYAERERFGESRLREIEPRLLGQSRRSTSYGWVVGRDCRNRSRGVTDYRLSAPRREVTPLERTPA
jgi:CubicO group peptidase (beta-lactamase class C family)